MTLRFLEERVEADGETTRRYAGLHATTPGGTPTGGHRIMRVPEDRTPFTMGWPPASAGYEGGLALAGDPRYGGWINRDIFGRVTRILSGDGGYTLIRRDAFGDLLQRFESFGGTWGDITNYDLDTTGTTQTIQELAIRPGMTGLNRVSWFKRYEIDAYGLVRRTVDGAGRARYYDYDEHGGVTTVAAGNGTSPVGVWASYPIYSRGDSITMHRDAHGRITGTEITVPNNPSIPSGKIEHGLTYTEGGYLEKIVDVLNDGERSELVRLLKKVGLHAQTLTR